MWITEPYSRNYRPETQSWAQMNPLMIVMHGTFESPSPCCCSSVAQSCPTLCNPMNCSTPGFPVLHHLPELAQTHVHLVSDTIQPSRPPSSPSLTAFSLSQHQGLFQWVGSSQQVAKVLELQHQSSQRIFRVDFLWDLLVWFPGSPRDSQESIS